MKPVEVGYLGPVGTYAHLVAEKRYGRVTKELVPLASIADVCAFVSGNPRRHGVVPVENSSGGPIYETIDILLANQPRVTIEEELSLNVRLALLGHKGHEIQALYSHFAPLEHCVTWINTHLPAAERRVVGSTALAAQEAALSPNAAALGSRRLAGLYGLNVIHFPVEADIPNLTIFLAISGKHEPTLTATKTTIAARTPNKPGGLCDLLETFRDEDVNLTRILSRPIRGCPREYAFLIDLDGAATRPCVVRALKAAQRMCVSLRIVGSYPARKTYNS